MKAGHPGSLCRPPSDGQASLSLSPSGYLIGYLVHRKKEAAPGCAATVLGVEDPRPHQDNVIPVMDWDDVKKLLSQKVSAANFEPVLA